MQKLAKYNQYLVCTVDTDGLEGISSHSVENVDADGLVLQQQGINSNSTVNTSMYFQLFMG